MPSHWSDARSRRFARLAALGLSAIALIACFRSATPTPLASAAPELSPQLPRWTRTPITIPGGTFDVAVSPSGVAFFGRFLSDSLVRVDVTTASPTTAYRVGRWPYDLAFNRTGALAYTTHLQDSTIGVINPSTGKQLASFPMGGEPIRVRVSRSDTLLFVTTVSGKLLTMRADDGNLVRPATTIGGVLNGLALTPDGNRVWVANTHGYVQEVLTATGRPARNFVMQGRPQDIAISARGDRMYISNEAGWIGVYDLVTLARIDSLEVPSPFGIALNPAGTQLWVASGRAGSVHVFLTATHDLAGTISVGGRPRHIAFAADGAALISNESSVSHIVRENAPKRAR